LIHFLICTEEVVVVVSTFSHAYNAVVGINVVTIPEASCLSSVDTHASQILKAFHDELNAGCRIGNKDQVEMLGIGTEKSQCSLPRVVDDLTRELGRRTSRMRIPVEI
jgi:hypothetical protein